MSDKFESSAAAGSDVPAPKFHSTAPPPRALNFLVPGDLRAATGGYVYDRRIIAGLRELGWRVTVHALDASFPHPSSAALAHAGGVLASLPAHSLVLVDGLALSVMPEVLRAHASRLDLVALMHMPLSAEFGIAPELARQRWQWERDALHAVRHVIVTSHRTRQRLLAYDISPERVSVIEPGTDEAPLARRRPGPHIEMLCVATLHAGKGHDLLFDALAPLVELPWHLTCVGSDTRSPQTAVELRAQLARLGLSDRRNLSDRRSLSNRPGSSDRLRLPDRITLTGEVEAHALTRYYLDADLFVLPTRFESYCMAVAEALAHGLPVVSTATGAIPELVGTQAGVVVTPGDRDGLGEALSRILREPALLARLAEGAAAARGRLPRWPDALARLASVLEGVAARRD